MNSLRESASASPNFRKILFLALSFYLVFGFGNVCYLLPVYYQQVGVENADSIGFLIGAFYFSSILSRPFLGNIVIRLGFKNCLRLAGGLALVGGTAMALSGTAFLPGILSRGILGIGSSLFQVTLATFQALAFPPNERGRAFSLIMAGGLAPMMTLVPIADILLHRGFNAQYIAFPVLIIACAAFVTPKIPGLDIPVPVPTKTAGQRRSPFTDIAACFRIKPLRLAFLSTFLFSVSDASAAFMGSMTAHYGLMASFFLSSNALVGVVIRLTCGRLIDRFHRGTLGSITTLITFGTLLCASIAPTKFSLIALGMIYGVGMGIGFPLHLALVSDCSPNELQSQAVSLSWFLIAGSFALVPPLSGLLQHFTSPVVAFRLITAPAFLMTLYTAYRWYRMRQSAQ